MIELIKDAGAGIAAFRASGKVTKQDYDMMVVPTIDQLVQEEGQIRFLLVLDTEVSNYTAGAWFDDILIGLKHLTKWHKMAIVSDQDVVNKFTDIFSFVAPGEAKGFKRSELEEAKAWVSA